MKIAVLGARLVLGVNFVVFGINPWLQFLPLPELNEPATAFFSFMATSYLLTFVKITEVVGGLLLLTGRFVPLALTILAPIALNILFFHIFLDTTGLFVAIFIVVLELFLAWAYRDSFAGVLSMNAKPNV
ncbi:MAG: DoxX family membrane protein [Acidobacteriota bacterium]